MAESTFEFEYEAGGQGNDLKRALQKYSRYWYWFLAGIVFCLGLGYLYMRYAPITYESVAKIEIIEEEESIAISADALSLLGQGSSVNMDNEVEVLRSYRILRQVVEALNLDISYYEVGNVKTTEIWNPPFAITKLVQEDSLMEARAYDITLDGISATITDQDDRSQSVPLNAGEPGTSGYPFDISMRPDVVPEDYEGKNFRVVLAPVKEAVLDLARKLRVEPISKNSEILSLSIRGESVERSESILNELINKFNQDGIQDRQLVSKRTLDFIDERFLSLSQELDSIEIGKEGFKRSNSLSYIESDADYSLQQRAQTEDQVTQLETQVSLADLLKKAVTNQPTFSFLPVDVGLENNGLNTMVAEFNELAAEREKFAATVRENHPTLISLSNQLQNTRLNILKTINIYQTQLRLSLRQLNRERARANTAYAQLPEKEKVLRSIERQQSIKENLFIILLQKREEAALNYAVTAPSIKVVDYALTDTEPLSPKKRIVYPMSLMMGMFVPFLILYLRFSLTNKVEERADLVRLNPGIPILGEIPTYKKGKEVIREKDRTVQAESFRILCTNIDYVLTDKEDPAGKCILVTSAVKGEGKSTTALNLALAYAGLSKKVLLVGADLRNPGLARFFKPESYSYGLSDYLSDTRIGWEECVVKGGLSDYLSVCLSGNLPPNPTQLLSGKRFEAFLEKAASEFEMIVVDSAPCMAVADTLLMARLADVSLFVVRAGYSEKSALHFSGDLHQKKQLPNMNYLLNDMGSLSERKY